MSPCQPWQQLLLLLPLAFEAQKTRKTVPKASKKKPNSIPNSIKIDFCEKLILAILSTRKPRNWSLERRQIASEINKKMTWKQTRKQIEKSSLGIRRAYKIESQNQFKINENHAPDHLVSILLFPWSSRVVPGCQNGPPGCPRGAKMVPRGGKMAG